MAPAVPARNPVSFDVTREPYTDVNATFAAALRSGLARRVTINQSRGGSSRHGLSVPGSLKDDAVTIN
jgi:ABC-type sulfate transport system substrate-binding protein